MPSTTRTSNDTPGVVPCKPLEILAEPAELRCSTCYNWYNPVPTEADKIRIPRNKPFLKRWAKRLVRDHCPKCRQEMVDLALVKAEEDTTRANHEEESKVSALKKEKLALQQKLRREDAIWDVRLYQDLIDTGAEIPPLARDTESSSDNDDHPIILLSRQQERALFRELQRRGAFDFPGMEEGFRHDFGEFFADDEKYRVIKEQGCRWDIYRGWVSERGKRVSFQPRNKNGRQQSHSAGKEWGSNMRVSGRKLPPRLDLGKLRLETIEESGEESEAEAASRCIAFSDITGLSTALAIKPGTPADATRSSPEIHFAGLQSGMLHTFQSATLHSSPVPHPLQSLGSTIERVNKGTLTSRLRGKALIKEIQEKDKFGILRKITRRIRR